MDIVQSGKMKKKREKKNRNFKKKKKKISSGQYDSFETEVNNSRGSKATEMEHGHLPQDLEGIPQLKDQQR